MQEEVDKQHSQHSPSTDRQMYARWWRVTSGSASANTEPMLTMTMTMRALGNVCEMFDCRIRHKLHAMELSMCEGGGKSWAYRTQKWMQCRQARWLPGTCQRVSRRPPLAPLDHQEGYVGWDEEDRLQRLAKKSRRRCWKDEKAPSSNFPKNCRRK